MLSIIGIKHLFGTLLAFNYPAGKLMFAHFLRYQGIAVDNYSVTLDVLYMDYPQLSLK
jgi:hypothetical protein